jgi:hypothetical protein
MRASRLAAAGLLLVALAFAGCGNPGHDFRVGKLNPLLQRVETQKGQLAATLRIVRPKRAQDVRAVRSGIAAIDATAKEIAKLKPPGSAQAEFKRFTRAYGGLVTSLSGFADALASGGSSQMTQASQTAQEATGTLQRAQEALLHKLGK